ncbi:hypothetical protein ACE1CI_08290 [Aerosakkonemataceae cyanobacterium BLCC-F50]|uniref:Uncharacterized protein n=1 Tax=Floridaenema flaviceps BLCC-F50 TaxID=3153642 RepID=A0ABV4XMH9_9CYAN
MLLNQMLAANDKQTIEEQGFLEITKNTVKLQNDVYQFRNVTGFAVGEVKTKGIPFNLIFILFIIAFASGNIPGFGGWSLMFWVLVVGAVVYNFNRPKVYGLSLYLNSGHEIVFATKNIDLLNRAVRTLKDFMENPQDFQYVNITVESDNKGNIVVGDIYGKVYNK